MKQTQYTPDGWGFDKNTYPAPVQKEGKRLKSFVIVVLSALLCLALFSCKTPKDITEHTKQKEQKDIKKEAELVHDAKLSEAISTALEKVLKEKLNIKLKQTTYDSDKPIDPGTGKPPIKEEKEVEFTNEKEETTKEVTEAKIEAETELKINASESDKSQIEEEHDQEIKAAPTWWQKLMTGLVIGALTIWLIVLGIKKLIRCIQKR